MNAVNAVNTVIPMNAVFPVNTVNTVIPMNAVFPVNTVHDPGNTFWEQKTNSIF